jgi:hypothetical protein
MNVGGWLAEVSRPPRNQASVGAAIVLGARENRVQGEAAIRSFEMTIRVRDEGSRPQGL